ncbi:hypothetical protein HRbin26_01550 [bacterium HR26]|nr:hypothetical protein HRbin26_01550 [bacterium HR26]
MPRRRLFGQSTVEFALIAVPFFLLVFGIIEGGRLVFTYHEIQNAAREGTRYMVAHGAFADDPLAPGDTTEVEDYVLSKTAGLEPASLEISANWLDGSNEPGKRVAVEVQYEFEPIVGMVLGADPITLTARSEMRIHY